MMYEQEKSDSFIVAMKSANNRASARAELMERRGEAKGNTGERRMCRTLSRVSMFLGLNRERVADVRFLVNYPRWEPGARIAPAGICAGGAP